MVQERAFVVNNCLVYTKDAMKEAVENVLRTIEISLKIHNGGLELCDINEQEGSVAVRFSGACVDCALSNLTFTQGVERALFLGVPGIKKVVLLKPSP